MENELLSAQISISPTLKNRLDQIARHRNMYNDVITTALNYYEACNCPKQVDEVHKISIRYNMQYQHVYFIWLEKNRSIDLTIEEIMKIKREGLIANKLRIEERDKFHTALRDGFKLDTENGDC